MRVLHLSTTLRGGAGIAAARLHQSLLDIGVESSMHTLSTKVEAKPELVFEIHRSMSKNIYSKLLTMLQLNLLSKKGKYLTPVSISSIDIRNVLSENPDVIHIHSTYNLLATSDYDEIRNTGIPLVFTLHDQRLFTGGCHYSGACVNYRNLCSNCPQTSTIFQNLISRSHIQMMEQIENDFKHHVVTPSTWLKELSMQSAVFKDSHHTVIHNPIPEYIENIEHPQTQGTLKTIGFIASNINNPVKNLNGLVSALKLIDSKDCNFNLLVAGEGDFPATFENIKIERLQISSPNELTDFYSRVSILVVPSFEDNSPNVVG